MEESRTQPGDCAGLHRESDWRFIGGQIALHEGRYDLARTLLTEELATLDHAPRSLYKGYCLMNVGTVAREQGNHAEADTHLAAALQLADQYGDRVLLAHALEGLSGLASARGQHERAVWLSGAAAALRDATGAPLSPAWRRMVERSLDLSRSALGNTVADAAWRAGQAAPLAQVISEARSTNAPMVVGAPVTNEPLPTAR